MSDSYKWVTKVEKYQIKWTIAEYAGYAEVGGGIGNFTFKLPWLKKRGFTKDDQLRTFVAPYAGIYRFSLSGQSNTGFIIVEVRKNGAKKFQISDGNDDEYSNNISATWIWQMELGDILDFRLPFRKPNVQKRWPLVITGELIGLP